MNSLILLCIILIFVFILTYDPKSRTLDRFISPEDDDSACRYQTLQFAKMAESCVVKDKTRLKENMGAVFGT